MAKSKSSKSPGLTGTKNGAQSLNGSKPAKAASKKAAARQTGSSNNTDDPIRMYLMQMGQIPMLTREEEVSAAKAIKPAITVIGVEPVGAPTLKMSIEKGRLVTLPGIDTEAVTLAPRKSAEINLDIVRRNVDDIILVSDDEMREAARWLWFEAGVAAELSGAASLAALQTGRVGAPAESVVSAIVCGTGSAGLV